MTEKDFKQIFPLGEKNDAYKDYRQVIRNNSKNAHQLQAGGHSLTCTVLQAVDLSCSQPFCAQVQKPYLECVQRNLGPVSSLSHTCNGTAL